MVAVAIACLLIVYSGRLIALEGGLLFFHYVLYTTYLVLREANPAASEKLATVAVWGIIPATILLAIHMALSIFASDHFKSKIEER